METWNKVAMQENKVISSKITIGNKPLQNNLYELIKVTPATPTSVNDVKAHSCDFQPVTGKTYTSKRRNKTLKVRTVRDIRNEFEHDVTTDLPKDLEKQQNVLLKRITSGSSREENTKAISRNIFKSDKPISRSAWQMIMNVNPEGHPHSIQYVFWNGRRIRVNGSKGGKNTFLCNYDLANVKISLLKENKHKISNKKKGLLRNSLTVKFKPGPLTRKTSLDDSYQKYNVGKTELVSLPKPALEVQPIYGVALEPIVANFVQNLRDVNGTISEKWANFAVSVLGTVKNTDAIQNSYENSVTFELNYKRDQRRMLLRRDIEKTFVEEAHYDTAEVTRKETDDTVILSDIETILKEMIDCVEISLQQDRLFTCDDEPREDIYEKTSKVQSATKDKIKKRFGELDRLAVTVIELPDVTEESVSKFCNNAYCVLGCICASLQRSYNLRQHCGRLECMFECKCDFSKYKVADSFDNECPELIPGLINLDNQLSFNMAKEEQKFHQTVVLAGEKSILLKSQRRNWKATKKYGDFYDRMCLKNYGNGQRTLSIAAVKLNCEHVEPWCMVHNLYKCFCKGKFTDKSANVIKIDDIDKTTSEKDEEIVIKDDIERKRNKRYRSERSSADNASNKHVISEYVDLDFEVSQNYETSARTRTYQGRKFSDKYYFNMNNKIAGMEKNDCQLRKRMLAILGKSEDSDTNSQSTDTSLNLDCNDSNGENVSKNINEIVQISSPNKNQARTVQISKSLVKYTFAQDRSILNTSSSKTKLVTWLETSYKMYKQRIEQGYTKKSLDPPKHGKVALYPWEFILSRYSERKNLFLVSQQTPFRIFMAVDAKNAFFKNCINIDDIRFADLHKYPVTVKNLLTNATDLKDNFCILCGLAFCWELIGSVTKVDGHEDTNQLQRVADGKKIGFVAHDKNVSCSTGKSKTTDEVSLIENNQELSDTSEQPENSESTKSKKRELHKRYSTVLPLKNDIKKTKLMSEKDITKHPNTDEYVDVLHVSEIQSINTNTHTATDINTIHSAMNNQDENSSGQPRNKNELQLLSKSQSNSETMSIQVMNVKEMHEQQFHETEINDESNTPSSKWFVMTVEDDFSEIQFYNRGFFVKYESIIKAINVARMSGKTVRLSSQKGCDQSNSPQFGIYAIPNASQYYVFIGPYDKDEPLGIETVKSFADIRKINKTRGVWITTKKVDNAKVIDNPLSFMPNLHSSKIVSLDNEERSNETAGKDKELKVRVSGLDSQKTTSEQSPQKNQPKVVKPITIRKTNGFYQLTPRGFSSHRLQNPLEGTSHTKRLLQPTITTNVKNIQAEMAASIVTQTKMSNLNYSKSEPNTQSLLKKQRTDEGLPQNLKPVAEIAPQIKILDVYSETETATQSQNKTCSKKSEGMFILKPEEINKRLMENRLASNNATNEIMATSTDLDQDIEHFLATSTVYVPPNADTFEISDDEQDTSSNNWRDVWIECETMHISGYIRGRKNSENMLSFEFPGFKFTNFYPEEEAFSKINQVLSRKIYVPKSIQLKWHVVEYFDALRMKNEIQASCWGRDFVLTKRGVRHKKALMIGPKSFQTATETTSKSDIKFTTDEVDKAIDIMSEMEEQSNILEEEGDMLMSEMTQIRKNVFGSLSQPESAELSGLSASGELRKQLLRLRDMSSDKT